MKKLFLLSVLAGAVSLSAWAQDDDMYFVPTKKNVASQRAAYGVPAGTYYSGSSRSVDDYNRWGSSYEVLPADTGDIITFTGVEGVYPDSVGDFQLTQQMARWDGYEPSTAYWDGYAQGRSDYLYGWHSPWYYSSYYPWYDSWYWDPWYHGGYWGWYDPWYYGGYWGWGGYYSHWYYRPWHYYGGWYGGGGGVRHHYTYGNGSGTGTIDRYGRTGGSFGGYRGIANSSRFASASGRTISGHTNYGTGTRTRVNTSGSGNFSGSRSSGSSYGSGASGGSSIGGSRSSGNSGGSFSSGGGSRSSVGSLGGGRSSGGGGRSGGSRR